jgi:flagellar biosynthesis protein
MSNNAPTNAEGKIKTAVALSYDKGIDLAPRVISKGSGWFADKILAIAKEHRIPIREDAELAKILSTLELNSYIPLEVYAVVAEILSYVYQKDQKTEIR